VTEKSSQLNAGLNGRDLAKSLRIPRISLLMIAANKVPRQALTFNPSVRQYVDKELASGELLARPCRRLNAPSGDRKNFSSSTSSTSRRRTVLDAFLPYYTQGELDREIDRPQIIRRLCREAGCRKDLLLQESSVPPWPSLTKAAARQAQATYCTPPRSRFAKRLCLQQRHGQHALDFKTPTAS